jgi:hypothetical protein
MELTIENIKCANIKPEFIQRSIDVLDLRDGYLNWKDLRLKYQGEPFKHVYSFDCEMVYVCKRDDNDKMRKNPSRLDKKILSDYNSDMNPKGYQRNIGPDPKGQPCNPDDAQSFVDFYGRSEFIRGGIDHNEWDNQDNLKYANKILKDKSLKMAVGQISITDWNGHIIYEKYVCPDTEVIWTCKKFSGIPQGFFTLNDPNYHIINGNLIDENEFATLDEVKMCLDSLFAHNDAKIIGHSILDSDFPNLEYKISVGINGKIKKVRDTAEYYYNVIKGITDGKIQRFKCSELVERLLDKKIQQDGGGHDPSEDARGSLALYKLDYENWETKMATATVPQIKNFEIIVNLDDIKYTQPQLLQLPAHIVLPPALLVPLRVDPLLGQDLATIDTPAKLSAALTIASHNTSSQLYAQMSVKYMEMYDVD